MKKIIKCILCVLLVLVVIAGAYLAYVFIDYHRIGNQQMTVEGGSEQVMESGTEYTILSYNIGFGAYEPDYGFFMDGGTESWAWSAERLALNLGNIAEYLHRQDADLYLLQEVDTDATRTYHMDETVGIIAAIGETYDHTFARNFDSPFLMYPLTQPHGASQSGILTLSRFAMTDAQRVELPVEEGLIKILDYDRCYSKQRIAVADGSDLVLYDFHLSAYTSDGTVATEQLRLLLTDMQSEYDRGNWCIAGGDFNKDLLGDSSVYFGASDKTYTWAQPIPEGTFDGCDITLIAPLDEENPVPSARNADGPYHAGQYVLTVDGFLVTPNVEVESAEVLDTAFAYSDHNPVEMVYILR